MVNLTAMGVRYINAAPVFNMNAKRPEPWGQCRGRVMPIDNNASATVNRTVQHWDQQNPSRQRWGENGLPPGPADLPEKTGRTTSTASVWNKKASAHKAEAFDLQHRPQLP